MKKMNDGWLMVIITITTIGWLLVYILVQPPKIVVNGQAGEVIMVAYGDVIKAVDGNTYRVTVTDTYGLGHVVTRDVDMYSRDGKYAYISASSTKGHFREWPEVTICTKKDLTTSTRCPRTADMAGVVDSVVQQVAVRRNTISNFEIYWSWSLESKEWFKELSSPQ